jgi:hypothetical protein
MRHFRRPITGRPPCRESGEPVRNGVPPTVSEVEADARARRIEEASLRAWPALTDSDFDGWRLRFADGYTRRANSITPLAPSRLALSDKIATCERLYAERGLPAIFRLTPFAPPDLDATLAARGYGLGDCVEVLARALTDIPSAPAPTLTAHACWRPPRGHAGCSCSRRTNVPSPAG